MSLGGKETHHPNYFLLNIPSLQKSKADFYAVFIEDNFTIMLTSDLLEYVETNFNPLGKNSIFYLHVLDILWVSSQHWKKIYYSTRADYYSHLGHSQQEIVDEKCAQIQWGKFVSKGTQSNRNNINGQRDFFTLFNFGGIKEEHDYYDV